ncbi:MAG: lipopolysaccharide heptosyltransferase II [Thermoanaerobaculia bacterium]
MSGGAPRTLVVMPNWVGDCVMAEPVLRALAASGRELAVLARPGLHSLLALFPGVVDCIARVDDGASLAAIRAGDFAEAVVLPNSFRSARLVRQAGIPRRIGYRSDLRGPLLAPAVARPRGRRPQIEDYRELLQAIGVAPPDSFVPRLELPAALVERGRERLERANLGGPSAAGPLVGLSPGAEWGPSKQWPMRRWSDLATELRRRRPGIRQAIFVGPKEIWLGVRIHEESGKIHPLLGPDLDLAGLAATIARLDLLVTNDSGPMHLAAALGVPCVALFGPTDQRRTAPAGDDHTVLDLRLWCSPCFFKRCPLLHHNCMRGLGVNRVADTVLATLSVDDPEPDPS